MKTVLITGASRGIGKAIALQMAKLGLNVAINYHADDATARQTLAECKEVNENVMLVKADVSRTTEVKAMFTKIMNRFGMVQIVVNNAGINIDRPLVDMSEDDWDMVVDVNMKGVFIVSSIAAKLMIKHDVPGHIINVSATTGIAGRKNGINYCASKAGVIVMTKCLAKELGPRIRANCVIPGITRTAEIEERFNLKMNETDEVLKRGIPLKRIGEPFEVANVISFLISEEAAYLNGQKIIVDGGEYMY